MKLAVTAMLAVLAIVGASSAARGAVASVAPRYHVIDLHPPRASSSETRDVEVSGIAAGMMTYGAESNEVTRGFFYDPRAGVVDIGTLGGASTVVVGMNSAGLVVGESQTKDGSNHAFLFTPGVGMRDLGGGSYRATDVDEAGDVIGLLPDGRSFLWTATGGPRDVGEGEMNAFSFTGKVFGDHYGIPGMWESPLADFVQFGSQPPPLLGYATAGNIFDEAAGRLNGLGSHWAFFWDGRRYRYERPEGFLYFGASGLNDASDLLVNASDVSAPLTPFVYYGAHDPPVNGNTLNPAASPFTSFSEFRSTDDVGDIGGTGLVRGEQHAVLLAPTLATQARTVGAILRHGLSPSDPFDQFVRRLAGAIAGARRAAACVELADLARSVEPESVPFGAALRLAAGAALRAIRERLDCVRRSAAAPLTAAHIFTRRGERERIAVRVRRGRVTVVSRFPRGSSVDIRLRGTRHRTSTSLRVRLARRRAGVLRVSVVATALAPGAALPVTTTIAQPG